MDLGLKQKAVLVTGASRGIGRAIALAFAAEGARVGVNYRQDRAGAEAVAAAIAGQGGQAVLLPGDVSREADVASILDGLEKAFSRVDVLVNNAAHCPSGPVTGFTREEWEKTFAINVTGAFLLSREAVRRWQAAGAAGAIVNIASQAAYLGSTSGHLPYDASKGALVSMTIALARETAPSGIRVNAVAPGMVLTEMVAAIWEAKKASYLARIPMARIGEPEEIASAVLFLASDRAGYMTGTVLNVSGGLRMG
jgi:3-oxoacyl-[acyl-carrier protein] reductase